MRDYEIVRGFIESPRFYKRWIALGFSEEDLLELQMVLISDPKIGPVMRGTGRLRKMRYAFEDRGKSGSVRVLYVDFEEHERIFFVKCFFERRKGKPDQG